jgi:hypothetical protein
LQAESINPSFVVCEICLQIFGADFIDQERFILPTKVP